MVPELLEILLTGPTLETFLDQKTVVLKKEIEELRIRGRKAKNRFSEATAERIKITNEFINLRDFISVTTQVLQKLENEISNVTSHRRTVNSTIESINSRKRAANEEFDRVLNVTEDLTVQIEVCRRREEELLKSTDLNSEFLKEILTHLSKYEDENLLLLKYASEEASQIKKLSVELSEVSQEVSNAEQKYREWENEWKCWRGRLRHQAENFSREMRKRRDFLLAWETSIFEIQEKNLEELNVLQEINNIGHQIKNLTKEKKNCEILKNQIESSLKEILNYFDFKELEAKKVSLKYISVNEAVNEMRAQINELSSCSSKLEIETQQMNEQMLDKCQEIERKNLLLEKFCGQCSKLKNEMMLDDEIFFTTQKSLNALEAILKERENQNESLHYQITAMRNVKQRHLREIFTAQNFIKLLENEITTLSGVRNRTSKDMKILTKRISATDELVFKHELEMEEIKWRINCMEGNEKRRILTDEEKEKIFNLKHKIFQSKQNVQNLKKSFASVKSEVLHYEREIEKRRSFLNQLDQSASFIRKDCDLTEKDAHTLRIRIEETCIDVSLVEVALKRKVEQWNGCQKEFSDVAIRRMDVDKLFDGEKRCLRKTIDGIKKKIRNLETEKSRMAKTQNFYNVEIDRMKNRYDEIRFLLNVENEDLEISPLTVCIKLAEEKSGLEQTGDFLDREVKKAEKETDGLQQLLSHVSVQHERIRRKIYSVTNKNDEKLILAEDKKSIEEDIQIWTRLRKGELDQLKELESEKSELELKIKAAEEAMLEKSMQEVAISRQIWCQNLKMTHVSQAVKILKSKLAVNKKNSVKLSDVELRVQQERLKTVSAIIGENIAPDSDQAKACVVYCQHEKIPPPVFKKFRTPEESPRDSIESGHSSRPSRRTPTNRRGSSLTRPSSFSRKNSAGKKMLHSSMISLDSCDSGSGSVKDDGTIPNKRNIHKKKFSRSSADLRK